MESYLLDFLSETFLFRGIDKPKVGELLDSVGCEVRDYAAREVVYSPEEYERKIGFLISGRCSVERFRQDGSSVLLNTLLEGDSFGVITVLTNEDFPTKITAKKQTKILFIKHEDFVSLLNSSKEICFNLIAFLGNRISFLNNKISTFSANNTEQKVAKRILSEYKSSGSLIFNLNCKRSAEELGIGRASFYRALDSLISDGYITYEEKKINIIDPMGLERITK